MHNRPLRAAYLAMSLAVLSASAPAAARAALPPLIPRSVLLGNPQKAAPAISPNGTMLAYLAPSNGVLSIWVRTSVRTTAA